MSSTSNERSPSGILVEAEAFEEYGGWLLDSQFETQMGSPYLLAHGLGKPVENARTVIDIPLAGRYSVWVRAKDWVPAHHPGRFTLSINGAVLETELGASGQDWSWQLAGSVELSQGDATLVLHDLTGFDGRCDAIFLTQTDEAPLDGSTDDVRSWRRQLQGIPDEPSDAGDFDVVIVGGGVAGSAAALSAARLGCTVALVQDRPYLGGNASVEIGLSPRGASIPLIKEFSARADDGDLHARKLLESESNARVFTEQRAVAVETDGNRIVAVVARDARTGGETRYAAPVFIDCTGTAILGILAGARTRMGQESQEEYGESLAPEAAEDMHHGNTVFFRTRMADEPVQFPDVPWAVEVAKDYADLGGQLVEPGRENGKGPSVDNGAEPGPAERRRMSQPLTHFWEYGQFLDPYTEGERIRDHLLRAIYGTFSNVKRLEPETYANLELDWVAFVAAQGEFRRYVGDYTLTENDLRDHPDFPDAVVLNTGAICMHHPGHEKYDFRLSDWTWDTRDRKPYTIPFRCLYSADVVNLLAAGKHISVSRVAGSCTKHMGNCAQHGIATAAAAFLCKKYDTTPRGLYESHLPELQAITEGITGKTIADATEERGA